LGVDLAAGVCVCGPTEDAGVLGEYLAVPVSKLLEKPRRAGDVGEQKGHGPARKFGRAHAGSLSTLHGWRKDLTLPHPPSDSAKKLGPAFRAVLPMSIRPRDPTLGSPATTPRPNQHSIQRHQRQGRPLG